MIDGIFNGPSESGSLFFKFSGEKDRVVCNIVNADGTDYMSGWLFSLDKRTGEVQRYSGVSMDLGLNLTKKGRIKSKKS